ncbi:SDR family oxidoreductase [Mesorhizobium sp. LHD-90]|uniref:SDR family oxidoreductase n=1 Tax=Mesorhizobium sp. LHD-90 TaxID=3071414 RepID=UPI0027E08CF0|nr:SDR family oxidoreductase [Mesorhizobium sp. LHD-90]MDQ6434313.1 SDR family oxidoreductase [Mesorhizobium sp. LHD-90]
MSQHSANVLVTGGAKRVGRAIVEDLAENGFGVAVHVNRSRAEGERLVADIRARGGRAALVTGDLTDMAVAESLVGEAETALGPMSIVVNNASVFVDDSATDFDWEVWDRHFAIHVKAPVALGRALAERLPDDGEGLVVNIVDQRVLRPNPRYFSYALSKSTLWAATRTMAQALAPRIRVNSIGPGPTFANEKQQPSDFQAQVDGLILRRGPELAEFGATIRYLWQARSVTGQIVCLDGGQHLAWETPDVSGMVE